MPIENFRIRWDRITALAIFIVFIAAITVVATFSALPQSSAAHWDTQENGCYHGRDIALNGGDVPEWLGDTQNYGDAFTTCYTEAQTNLNTN